MNPALVSFGLYMVAVFALAWFASRKSAKGQSFVGEYFLGGRAFGLWAFALTFAATNASGGTFMGFPAKIYMHGWVLALWIAGFMVVPLVAMGLLGKRLNLVARKTGALTLPEVLGNRSRFLDLADRNLRKARIAKVSSRLATRRQCQHEHGQPAHVLRPFHGGNVVDGLRDDAGRV